jgi:hypothetical protein
MPLSTRDLQSWAIGELRGHAVCGHKFAPGGKNVPQSAKALDVEILGVERGEVIDRAMYQGHVGRAARRLRRDRLQRAANAWGRGRDRDPARDLAGRWTARGFLRRRTRVPW